jgi:hypothetical protein
MMTPRFLTSTRNAATKEVEVAGARKAGEKTPIQWRRSMMKIIDLYNYFFIVYKINVYQLHHLLLLL